jgi:Transglycosylase SLT domain
MIPTQPDNDLDLPPATVARPTLTGTLTRLVLAGLGTVALALTAAPAIADPGGAIKTTTSQTPTATAPATQSPNASQGQTGAPAATTTTPATTAPNAPAPGGAIGTTTPTTTTPEVQAQSPQAPSVSKSPAGHRRAHKTHGSTHGGVENPTTSTVKRARRPAPLPSALTPPLPGALGTPIGGIPEFFIESFGIPPFLLPIYQAAGTAYGIPWQVLAAINEVETDYGRDLSISSAGAEGWMQFLPSSWAQYGVDANGDGYEDPYNPADAIFAAARYLAAAGGAHGIRAAVFSYNHSQAYVESVMLRAQLLDGTPPELLSAIADLTESRFPVHAPAHFADGFPTVSAAGSQALSTLAGTTIYSQAGAPAIAVQDGRITAIGDSPTLGRYVSLRDAYGNTYTYAQLGNVAELYPVLEPRNHTAVSPRIAHPGDGPGPQPPAPSAPASAGVQPHSPLSQGAITSGLAMGAAAGLEGPPAPAPSTPAPALPPRPATPRVFRAGPDEVYLHALRPGVEVLAGTVLGHLGTASEAPSAPGGGQASVAPEPHMLFQIRPAGAGAPQIDPKPILDGWVQLENTSIFRARGENPFLATSPTVGQVLLESKPQLQEQVLRDPGIHFASHCERGEIQAGQVDRRVLAVLEYLSVSGLKPTVSPLSCAHPARAVGAANAAGGSVGDAVDISAIDGTPIAGHEGQGSIAEIAVRRLLRLQGTMKPQQIVSSTGYPGTDNTLTLPGVHGLIRVDFQPISGSQSATAARAAGSPLSPRQWLALIARLGEIPDPVVVGRPSAAAILDGAGAGTNPGGTGGH